MKPRPVVALGLGATAGRGFSGQGNHRPPRRFQSTPADLRRRRDLVKIVEKARQMAAGGPGPAAAVAGPGPVRPGRAAAIFVLASDRQAPRPAPAATFAPWTPTPRPNRRWIARGLGTLVHAVLAEIDFAPAGGRCGIGPPSWPTNICRQAQGRLEEPIAMVERFLASPRAAEIAAATERAPRIGVPAGLAARCEAASDGRAGGTLPARLHRLPLL